MPKMSVEVKLTWLTGCEIVLNATIYFVVVCISGLTLSSAGNFVLGDPALPVAF